MSRCVKSIIDKCIDQSLRQDKYKIRYKQINIINIINVNAVSFESSALLTDNAFLADDAFLANDAFLTDNALLANNVFLTNDAFLANDVFIKNQSSSFFSLVSSTSVSNFIFMIKSSSINIVYI